MCFVSFLFIRYSCFRVRHHDENFSCFSVMLRHRSYYMCLTASYLVISIARPFATHSLTPPSLHYFYDTLNSIPSYSHSSLSSSMFFPCFSLHFLVRARSSISTHFHLCELLFSLFSLSLITAFFHFLFHLVVYLWHLVIPRFTPISIFISHSSFCDFPALSFAFPSSLPYHSYPHVLPPKCLTFHPLMFLSIRLFIMYVFHTSLPF